jgi:hypothetical protein
MEVEPSGRRSSGELVQAPRHHVQILGVEVEDELGTETRHDGIVPRGHIHQDRSRWLAVASRARSKSQDALQAKAQAGCNPRTVILRDELDARLRRSASESRLDERFDVEKLQPAPLTG